MTIKAKPIRFYELQNAKSILSPNSAVISNSFFNIQQNDDSLPSNFAYSIYENFEKIGRLTASDVKQDKYDSPTHFDISEFYSSLPTDTDEEVKNPITLLANETKIRATSLNWDNVKDLEEQVNTFTDEWSKEFTKVAQSQNLVWAIPPFKKTFVYLGRPVDMLQNAKGCYVYRWETDDGYILIFTSYEKETIDKKNNNYYKGIQLKVRLDNFGRVHTVSLFNEDIEDFFSFPINTTSYNEELYLEHKVDIAPTIAKGLDGELFERFYEMYYILETFAMLNIKSEHEILKVEDTKPNKKERQRAKKTFDIDTKDMVFKTLKINPNLRIKTKTGYKRLTFGGLKEHTRRGHTKTYTPERPRFGKAHKNNIGTFFYPETIVGESSNGIVHKDYEFSEDE